MERLKPYVYSVAKQEAVSILVTPVGFAPVLVVGSGGSTELKRIDGTKLVEFRFTVSKPSGDAHRVRLAFDFPPKSGTSDHYHIHVSGKELTGWDVPDHYAVDGDAINVRFEVA